MARENGLWAWLKKAKLHFRENLSLGRIENAVGAGWPDVEGYLPETGQLWIELKSAARPASPLTPINLKHTRDAQVRWLSNRWALGQAVFILVQVGDGADGRRYLIEGRRAQEVHDGQTEAWLKVMSRCDAKAKPHEVLLACTRRK